MTKKDENLEEVKNFEDLEQEIQEEIDQDNDQNIDKNSKKIQKDNKKQNKELEILTDKLARTVADFENFKMRVERDKADMIFYIKSDIFSKILPRIDDLDRIIKNTPKDLRKWPLYEWIVSIQKSLNKDLNKMWVRPFDSIWKKVNPDIHEVMSQVPSEWKSWIIIDEFEKWYMLEDRVLRVAKVVVGA